MKLSLTNTRGLLSNSIVCESCLQSNAPDILTLSNLEDSIDSSKFPVRGYLHLIRKNSLTCLKECCFPDCLKISSVVYGTYI